MKNDSVGEMIAELKSSPVKLAFMAFLILGGVLAILDMGSQQDDPIAVSYSDLMSDIYLSDRTTAQQEQVKGEFQGKYVSWSGDVVDVQEKWPGYQVSVGTMGTLFTDIVLSGVSESEALALSSGDEIRFTGQIDRIEDARITGTVYLSDVQVK